VHSLVATTVQDDGAVLRAENVLNSALILDVEKPLRRRHLGTRLGGNCQPGLVWRKQHDHAEISVEQTSGPLDH
jgi:hypothetical protein